MTNLCIVVNSSVVIALAKINMLDILASLYKEVIVPSAVYEEVVIKGQNRPGSQELRTLIQQNRAKISTPENQSLVKALHDPLGLGEAEAIALALERNCRVALDDRIARSKAKSMGLKVVGTLGLLREAYDEEMMAKDILIRFLKQLKHQGFRISDDVIHEILEELN